MGRKTSFWALVSAALSSGLLLALLAAAGWGGASTPSRESAEGPAAPTASSAEAPPLVGEWKRVTECAELVHALRQAGLGEFAAENAAANGFIPGVTSADELADPARPCKGAVPREHSHFFTEEGQFGSLNWNGEQVYDNTYEIVDEDTFVIGPVTFDYQAVGDTITFDPVIPSDCSTRRCRSDAQWSVAVAYPGKKWQRVG